MTISEFKTDEELKVYLNSFYEDREYTGAFKNKENGRSYFEKQGLDIETQEYIDSLLNSVTCAVINTYTDTNDLNDMNDCSETEDETAIEAVVISRKDAILKLQECNYRTSPEKIALLLSQVFKDPNTSETHWLYIAHSYSPRTINAGIKSTFKQIVKGRKIDNPSAYFTTVMSNKRKRRTGKTLARNSEGKFI